MDGITRTTSESAAESDPARAWATEHYGFEGDEVAPTSGSGHPPTRSSRASQPFVAKQSYRSGLRVSKAGAAALLGAVLALGGGAAAVAAEADGGPGGRGQR
jgi:hypothetical protein